MKFNDLEKCVNMFKDEGIGDEDIEEQHIYSLVEKDNLEINILLEKQGDSTCTISNAEQKGSCLLTIKGCKQELSALVSIEELRIAIRKLVAR